MLFEDTYQLTNFEQLKSAIELNEAKVRFKKVKDKPLLEIEF